MSSSSSSSSSSTSNNISCPNSNNHNDNLELARLLLGLNCLIWKRLCYEWQCLLHHSGVVDLSLNFYEFNNENRGISEYSNNSNNTSSLSFNSSSSSSSTTSFSYGLLLHSNKGNNYLLAMKYALKTYLNSSTFLRNCRFILKHKSKNNISRSCYQHQFIKTTSTTSASPSTFSEYWRLKQIHFKNDNDDNRFYEHQHQQQSVYFVLPPYRLYTLLNVISHNDEF
ncbi:unnamed protein product [Schistosoma turkestanicum]|nr:unnamed protein product [Schistosoma turkestanicum]